MRLWASPSPVSQTISIFHFVCALCNGVDTLNALHKFSTFSVSCNSLLLIFFLCPSRLPEPVPLCAFSVCRCNRLLLNVNYVTHHYYGNDFKMGLVNYSHSHSPSQCGKHQLQCCYTLLCSDLWTRVDFFSKKLNKIYFKFSSWSFRVCFTLRRRKLHSSSKFILWPSPKPVQLIKRGK